MRRRHPGNNAEWDEESILCAQHELADSGEPPDPRGLAEGMLLDVPHRFGAGRLAVNGFRLSAQAFSALR
jgi:hypothetical protein